MSFNLAGFAEGLNPGLQSLAQKIHDGQVAKAQLNALVGSAQQAAPPPGQPQPGGPPPAANQNQPPMQGPQGAPPSPQGAPGGPPAALPGSTPMPQGATPQTAPQGPGGVSPMQPPPQAAPQPPPQGGSGPGLGGAPDPQGSGASSAAPGDSSAAPPTMSGAAQPTGNPWMDDQKTLKSMLMDLKQRNPHASPRVIMEAAEKNLGLMKGIDSGSKALIQYQIAALKADTSTREALLRHQDREDQIAAVQKGLQEKMDALKAIQDAKDTTAVAVEAARARAQEDVAKISAGARTGAARIGAGARLGAAEIEAKVKAYTAELDSNTKLSVEDKKAAVDAYKAQLAEDAKIFGAQAGNAPVGEAPKPPAQRPAPGSGAPAKTPEGRPPFPAAHEGQTAHSPNGDTWVVRNGKWVKVKPG